MGKLMDTYMSKKMPMGMHKMEGTGMMMSDAEMEKMMKKTSKKKIVKKKKRK